MSLNLYSQDVIQSDRDALMALYNATDGPSWANNTNWGSAELVSTWYGITVIDDRVTALDLRVNQLIGSIPASLGNLTALTALYLRENELSGSIPSELGNLLVLEYLSLAYNQLSGSIPSSLGGLTALYHLYLNDNQLSGTIPSELGNLTALDDLHMYNNQLSGTIPTELGDLTVLRGLHLSYNQLSGTIPSELGNLTALEQLNLENNQLSGSISGIFDNLTSLRYLNLGENQLTGPIPSDLSNLVLLEVLALYNNPIGGTIPSELGNLTALTRLDLWNNQLSGTIPPELGNLTALDNLSLGMNQLSGSIPTELGNLTVLTSLGLEHNQLSGSIPSSLSSLTALYYLGLRDNQLSGPLPDFSGFNNFFWLSLLDNYFTYEAIEATNLYSFTTEYIPQHNFQLTSNTFEASLGSNVDINISSISINNLGGSNNRYAWYKDGVPVSSASPSPILSLTAITENDYGIYTCHVTNTMVPTLTLYSNEIYLNNNDPMVFSSTTTTQLADVVALGETNQEVIWVEINTHGAQSPLSVSNFYFNTNGSSNAAIDITASRLFYTGDTKDLENRVQFGSDIFANGNFSFTGTQELIQGLNNFCLVYDISPSATLGSFVDAECTQITVASTDYTPDVTAPEGNAEIVVGDRSMLMALYNATDGPNWRNNTNWGTAEPLSTWYGVTATGVKVTEIDLYSNELKGLIPPEIGEFNALTKLKLDYNELSGNVPAEIGNLSSLIELNLSGNTLNGSIPNEFGNLSSIEILELRYNELSGTIPAELSNLKTLIVLELSENQLSGSIPSEFGNLTALTELSLWGNQLTGSIPPELGNLTGLTELNLNMNQLSGFIPPEVGNLNSLIYLRLSDNQLTGSIPATIGNLGSLRQLFISNNQLTGTIPTTIGNLTILAELSLNNNQLNGSIPATIGNLGSLVWMNLYDNQLSGSIPPEIGNLSIMSLNLSNNQLIGSIPSEIGNINGLMSLNLSNNKIYGNIPDLSGSINLSQVYLKNNYFTFEAIETVLLYSFTTEYIPQNNFQLTSNQVVASLGSNVDIDISSISVHDLGGSNNRYAWYKDGVEVSSPSTNSVLSITATDADDYGVYTCQVTNTVITDLTLISENIYLNETANTAPVVAAPISDRTEDEGFGSTTVDLTGVFTDSDGDALNYTVSSSNASVAAVIVSGTTLTITEVGAGTTSITVTATDGKGSSVENVFLMNINATGNTAPVIAAPISDRTEDEGFGSTTVDLTDVFTDADGDALSYTVVSANTDVAMVSIIGTTLTITEVGWGTATITITALDGKGGSAEDKFLMNINAAGNSAPVVANQISDRTEDEGFGSTTVDLTGAFTDADGDALSYIAESSDTQVASVNVNGTTLTIAEVGLGTATITVTALDGKGGSAIDAFTITISVSTHVKDIDETKIKVYPNPTRGILRFELGESEFKSIKVYNLTGKLLINKTTLRNNEIDLSQLNAGIYQLIINTGKESFTARIIKE